jgi:glucose/arabinose dehydrogenase
MNRQLGLAILAGGAVVACSRIAADGGAANAASPTAKTSAGMSVAMTEAQQRTNVSRLYRESCAKCHGERAEGGGGGTPSLLSPDKFDQKWDKPFFDAIKKGVPNMGMEAFGESLSDPEIWALVVHIRERQEEYMRENVWPSQLAVGGTQETKHHAYRMESVIEPGRGLRTPWGIDWLPDGTMIVTNRSGSVHLFKNGELGPAIEGIPASTEIGQGGMMEVTVHPQYVKNGWIYLGFTDPKPGSPREGQTKIVRGKLQRSGLSARWVSQQTIFECAPDTYNGSGVHFGNRIVFDGKGHIFFSIGERGNENLAQDLSKPNGKVYRVKEDGTVPNDNPFVNQPGAIKAIWSYGHRNPQGLAFDGEGRLWDTEHAPRGGDEVNLVEKGSNYGWPVISFGINYQDTPKTIPWPTEDQNFAMPVFRWIKSIGACGMSTGNGKAFPQWKGDIFAGGLSGRNVDRFRFRAGKMVEQERILAAPGRVREVAVGPDGFIYVALNQPDTIVRLVPAR